MSVAACSPWLATSSDSGARTAVVCASAVVHGNSGAESAEDLSARFARPIQGARYLNRASRLAVLAVDRLGLARCASPAGTEQLGVIAATFGAHFEQSRDQITELLTKERPLVSPMLGPNSIPSSISSCVSIYLDAQAFTLTFCDCGTAGIEGLAFAARAVSSGRARRVVVIGVETRPADIESALFGESCGAPPDEAYALLVGERNDCSAGGGQRTLRFVMQARRFGGSQDGGARRLALRRCLSQVAERAHKLDVPVDLFLGDLRRVGIDRASEDLVTLPLGWENAPWLKRQVALNAELDDLMTLAPGWEDAHLFDDRRCHPGLQCTAGLAHVAALHALVESGQLPEGLIALRRGRRALDQLRGAIVVNASADGTVACTLLRAEMWGEP